MPDVMSSQQSAPNFEVVLWEVDCKGKKRDYIRDAQTPRAFLREFTQNVTYFRETSETEKRE